MLPVAEMREVGSTGESADTTMPLLTVTKVPALACMGLNSKSKLRKRAITLLTRLTATIEHTHTHPTTCSCILPRVHEVDSLAGGPSSLRQSTPAIPADC